MGDAYMDLNEMVRILNNYMKKINDLWRSL